MNPCRYRKTIFFIDFFQSADFQAAGYLGLRLGWRRWHFALPAVTA
jgi:hypothetical protein